MKRAELRKALDVWPTVLRLATDPWAKEFASSVWQQAGDDRNWMPSLKQAAVMRRMVRELRANTDDEVTLIES